jgi:drug/metabolite transporter (DMT)-like permease
VTGEEKPLKGVLLVVAASFLFAVADALGKHLVMLYAAVLILAVRYAANLVLVTLTMWPRHRSALWHTRRTGLVVLRGLCLTLSSVTFLAALQAMPVAETVAIVYLTPVLVVLAAGPFLGEVVRPQGWIGALLGFAGVLLIARPGSGLETWGVALTLISAVLSAGYHLLTRALMRSETTMALMFHTALAGTVVFALMTAFLGIGTPPLTADVGLMLALGALTSLGHLCFTAAYREAPASTLAPVNYMHVAFATALGWLAFGQLPDAPGFAGMAAIAAAGLIAAWRPER